MQFLPISRYLGYTQSATGGNPSDAVGLAVAARSVIAAECIAIICTDSPNVNKKIKIFHKHRNLLFQKDSVVITNGIDRPIREWLYQANKKSWEYIGVVTFQLKLCSNIPRLPKSLQLNRQNQDTNIISLHFRIVK